jgi:hypothetical protein
LIEGRGLDPSELLTRTADTNMERPAKNLGFVFLEQLTPYKPQWVEQCRAGPA